MSLEDKLVFKRGPQTGAVKEVLFEMEMEGSSDMIRELYTARHCSRATLAQRPSGLLFLGHADAGNQF